MAVNYVTIFMAQYDMCETAERVNQAVYNEWVEQSFDPYMDILF